MTDPVSAVRRRSISFDVLAQEATPSHLAALIGARHAVGNSYHCPFHADDNASATIGRKDDRTVFRCFQCEEKGSPVQVVAKVWSIGQREAGEKLARHIGIDVARWIKRKRPGRPPRKAGPGRVPAELYQDPQLGACEIALYTILTGFRDVYPTYEELAGYLRCSESTVRRAAKKLRSTGWIAWRRRRHGNEYSLFWAPVETSRVFTREHSHPSKSVHPRTLSPSQSVHP